MHKNITDLFPDYIEKKLEAKEKMVIENHLSACMECLRQYKLVKSAWEVLEHSTREELPPFLKTRIAAKIRQEEKKTKPAWQTAISGLVYILGLVTGFVQTDLLQASLSTLNDGRLLKQTLDTEKLFRGFF